MKTTRHVRSWVEYAAGASQLVAGHFNLSRVSNCVWVFLARSNTYGLIWSLLRNASTRGGGHEWCKCVDEQPSVSWRALLTRTPVRLFLRTFCSSRTLRFLWSSRSRLASRERVTIFPPARHDRTDRTWSQTEGAGMLGTASTPSASWTSSPNNAARKPRRRAAWVSPVQRCPWRWGYAGGPWGAGSPADHSRRAAASTTTPSTRLDLPAGPPPSVLSSCCSPWSKVRARSSAPALLCTSAISSSSLTHPARRPAVSVLFLCVFEGSPQVLRSTRIPHRAAWMQFLASGCPSSAGPSPTRSLVASSSSSVRAFLLLPPPPPLPPPSSSGEISSSHSRGGVVGRPRRGRGGYGRGCAQESAGRGPGGAQKC